jgi:hypothetical protein
MAIPARMAGTLLAALVFCKIPFDSPPAAFASDPTARLNEAMGVEGQINGGVYRFRVGWTRPANDAARGADSQDAITIRNRRWETFSAA